jgi:hypothetical protein
MTGDGADASGRRCSVDRIPEQIEVAGMARGFLDHVHEDPLRLTGPLPNEETAPNSVEGVESRGRGATRACAGVNVEDLLHRFLVARVKGPVGVICHRSGCPRFGRFHSEQPLLEPSIFCPRQVLHDAAHGEVGGREHSSTGLRMVEVSQLGHHDVPVLIEALLEGGSLVARAQFPPLESFTRSALHSGLGTRSRR